MVLANAVRQIDQWNREESSEINSYRYGTWSYSKATLEINEEGKDYSPY